MKDIKLYNLIFPIWMLLFFPPIIFITLIGNFIIDSLVIIASFYLFKLSKKSNLKTFYKNSILKVWIFGFVADFIGAFILVLLMIMENSLGLSYELTSAISYDPFSHPLAVIIIFIAMLLSSTFILIFNYKFTFKTIIEEKVLRLKIALMIAILTIPWTFLLPTHWFY